MPNKVSNPTVSEMNHCRRCGTELQRQDASAIFICNNNHTIFDNARPAVGVILLKDTTTAILGVRAHEPHAGTYDTIGGFVDIGETVEQALEREIYEEAGLKNNQYSKPNYLCSFPVLYEYKGEHIPVVSMFFTATLHAPLSSLIPGDDIAGIHVQPLETLNPEHFPQSDVRNAICYAKENLS